MQSGNLIINDGTRNITINFGTAQPYEPYYSVSGTDTYDVYLYNYSLGTYDGPGRSVLGIVNVMALYGWTASITYQCTHTWSVVLYPPAGVTSVSATTTDPYLFDLQV